jgi:hypothetical protein
VEDKRGKQQHHDAETVVKDLFFNIDMTYKTDRMDLHHPSLSVLFLGEVLILTSKAEAFVMDIFRKRKKRSEDRFIRE